MSRYYKGSMQEELFTRFVAIVEEESEGEFGGMLKDASDFLEVMDLTKKYFGMSLLFQYLVDAVENKKGIKQTFKFLIGRQ